MGNENEKTLDYGTFLADLERKKSLLEQAIASLKAVMAGGALSVNVGESMAMVDDVSSLMRGNEVPVGAFLGKSIPEAAKLALQIVKRKMTSREIADNLRKGGIESTSKSFPSIVHSILVRASKGDTGILKLDRSYWGLADWYPAGLRGGSGERRNGAKAKPRRTRSRKAKTESEKQGPSAGGTQERIVQLLRNKPGTEYSPREIADSLGMRIQTVHFLLGKLAYRKAAEKTAGGKYRTAAA